MTYLNSYHEQQHKIAKEKISKQPRITSAQALQQVKEGRKKDLEYEKMMQAKLKAVENEGKSEG
jgi:hypothetical protein